MLDDRYSRTNRAHKNMPKVLLSVLKLPLMTQSRFLRALPSAFSAILRETSVRSPSVMPSWQNRGRSSPSLRLAYALMASPMHAFSSVRVTVGFFRNLFAMSADRRLATKTLHTVELVGPDEDTSLSKRFTTRP